jgi:hypothetical protein
MIPAAGRLAGNNPFASGHVRPGALAFLFPTGTSLGDLLDRLRRQGWWGQIVGAHGSGKSTLLAALIKALPTCGLRPLVLERHADETRLSGEFQDQLMVADRKTIAVIDGFEQLGFWTRRLVRSSCRRLGIGLVVTAHRSLGLPDLYRTYVTPEIASCVVRALLANTSWAQPSESDLSTWIRTRRGSLRDVLFDLYDRFEVGRTA